MKSKSIVQQALEVWKVSKQSPDYGRIYRALHQRLLKQKKKGKRVTVESLTKDPLRQVKPRGALRSKDLKISSLNELFAKEAELACELDKTRKEIIYAIGKGIGEARKRKIDIAELVEGVGAGSFADHA